MKLDGGVAGGSSNAPQELLELEPLEVTEELYLATCEAVPGYLVVADRSGRIQMLNRVPPGRAVEHYLGRDFLELVPSDQHALVEDGIQRVLGGGAAVELEVRAAESGRWFRTRLTGISRGGAVAGFVAHSDDIDDAKHTRAELDSLRARLGAGIPPIFEAASADVRAVQRRLGLMADALPVLVSYVDRDRRYRYNNAAYSSWFGSAREALNGRPLEEVLGPEAYGLVRGYVDTVLEGQPVTFEMTLPYRNAGVRTVVAHYVPDFTNEDEVAGFFALIEDISHRRAAEDALRQRERELRELQKMGLLGRLAAGIAHDFNNLLQAIVNCCATLLITLPQDDSTSVQTVLQVKSIAERGAGMTRQLLAFSRRDATHGGPLRVDLAIQELTLLLKRLLGAHVVLETELEPVCPVSVDAGQFQQILLNLAINARDAMPNGGTVRLVCRSAEAAGTAGHPGLAAGRYAVVEVADTGVGMDETIRSRLFEPFFTTKGPEQGTGLGLSTVRGIVRGVGGQIRVDSAPGKGTTFTLYLPCADLTER